MLKQSSNLIHTTFSRQILGFCLKKGMQYSWYYFRDQASPEAIALTHPIWKRVVSIHDKLKSLFVMFWNATIFSLIIQFFSRKNCRKTLTQKGNQKVFPSVPSPYFMSTLRMMMLNGWKIKYNVFLTHITGYFYFTKQFSYIHRKGRVFFVSTAARHVLGRAFNTHAEKEVEFQMYVDVRERTGHSNTPMQPSCCLSLGKKWNKNLWSVK